MSAVIIFGVMTLVGVFAMGLMIGVSGVYKSLFKMVNRGKYAYNGDNYPNDVLSDIQVGEYVYKGMWLIGALIGILFGFLTVVCADAEVTKSIINKYRAGEIVETTYTTTYITPTDTIQVKSNNISYTKAKAIKTR